ncbi:MAG: hypothetical protein U1E65_25775 [Myxococcota bacterium]
MAKAKLKPVEKGKRIIASVKAKKAGPRLTKVEPEAKAPPKAKPAPKKPPAAKTAKKPVLKKAAVAKKPAAKPPEAPKPTGKQKSPPASAKITAPPTSKEKKMVNVDRADAGAKKSVVRLVKGRVPKIPAPVAEPPKKLAKAPATPAPAPVAAPATRLRKPSPKVEINPKLQRSKHLVTAQAEPAPEAGAPSKKPMSVAEKNRAMAEAVFARLSTSEPAAPAQTQEKKEEVQLPFSARHKDEQPNSYVTRVSERDTLTTLLRMASSKAEALSAATELADRFSLPPDQGLLTRVMELGDQRLTKLALEELLELDDRGRVRGTPELRGALGRLKHKDPEIQELKQLFIEKLGGPV